MSRAMVPESTVRIGKNGVGSLSEDLFVSSRLSILGFDPDRRELRFRCNDRTGIKVYKSAPGAKSGTCSLKSVLKMYGLENAAGHMYEAQLEGRELVVKFKRRCYVGKANAKNGSRRS